MHNLVNIPVGISEHKATLSTITDSAPSQLPNSGDQVAMHPLFSILVGISDHLSILREHNGNIPGLGTVSEKHPRVQTGKCRK